VASFSFPTGNGQPIADGVRHPQTPARNYWYTEVNRFGLVYTEIGFTGRGDDFRDAITCDLIASLIMANLQFSMNLYEGIGYFGLVDFHCDVAPTLNRYPFSPNFINGHLTENRTLEDTISLVFTSSVKEIRESLLQRAREKYREFMWAFGLDVSDDTASAHFASFGIS
jgi:hypothetical protein